MPGLVSGIHVLLSPSIQITASYAGLTRVSIDLRETRSKRMGSRVKPGYDACFQGHVRGIRHCEERSDEAIQSLFCRFARNDGSRGRLLRDQSFTTRTAPSAALVA